MFFKKRGSSIFILYVLCFSLTDWLIGGRVNLQSEKLGLSKIVEHFLGSENFQRIQKIQSDVKAFETWKDCFNKLKLGSKKFFSEEELRVILYLCAVGAMQLDDEGPYNLDLVSIIYDHIKYFSNRKNEGKLTKKQRGLYFWILKKLAPCTASILKSQKLESTNFTSFPEQTLELSNVYSCPDFQKEILSPRTRANTLPES